MTLNRTGANKSDLDNEVVKTAWLHPWQRGHLGSRLDLEDTDRVGLA